MAAGLGGALGLAMEGCTSSTEPRRAGPATSESTQAIPLREQAASRGLIFGSSLASWQLDPSYGQLYAEEAGVLLTEDDLLWSRLKPRPGAPEDFATADLLIDFAEQNEQLTVGAHLVWDGGFGVGWSDSELRSLGRDQARELLFGVVQDEVEHYAGRMSGWIVANEVTGPTDRDANGFRTDVPWYGTIGAAYVAQAFHLVEQHDHSAVRIINEFGFETTQSGTHPEPRRAAFLEAIDYLLEQQVPVQAAGIQAHLVADEFGASFDERGYRSFLSELADRGLHILVTELDVLDDGLPVAVGERDRGVADVYRRYLDVTLDESAVKAVITFGLTNRYTWLEEDQPREDGAARRPLAFDRQLRPTPSLAAIGAALLQAPHRETLWTRAS
jgi:endo-1,4-beta-xylanase